MGNAVGSLDRVRALHHLHRLGHAVQRGLLPRADEPVRLRPHRDRPQHRTQRNRRWLVRPHSRALPVAPTHPSIAQGDLDRRFLHHGRFSPHSSYKDQESHQVSTALRDPPTVLVASPLLTKPPSPPQFHPFPTSTSPLRIIPSLFLHHSVVFCEVVGIYGVIGCQSFSPTPWRQKLTPRLLRSDRLLRETGRRWIPSRSIHRRQLLHRLLPLLRWSHDGNL